MGDRAYTSAPPKPVAPANGRQLANGNGAGHAAVKLAPPPGAAARAQVLPPPYRRKPPPPPPRRLRNSCRFSCCACFCWLVMVVLGLLVLAALACGIFYIVYRPQRPSFSVTSARFAALNVSDADVLAVSRLNLTVTARNLNQKISFVYSDIFASASVAGSSDGGVSIGDGSVPGFLHQPQNTTVLKISLASAGKSLDPVQASTLRKKSFVVDLEVETKAGIKIGRFKSKQIGIRVSCTGFTVSPPAVLSKGPNATLPASAPVPAESPASSRTTPSAPSIKASSGTTSTVDTKCKPRIKIWIWTF